MIESIEGEGDDLAFCKEKRYQWNARWRSLCTVPDNTISSW